MQCGIMRVEKRKRGDVYGLQLEANRTMEDHMNGRDFDRSDIDWARTNDNIHLKWTSKWNEEITRQIHEANLKARSNSTVMIDGVYTASPEFFENLTRDEMVDYFKSCYDFHVSEYCQGDESRIINAVIHLDEKTPHMQIASVPIYKDEKGYHLSAKELLGGRKEFRAHQNSFYEEVSREYGLERGEVRDDKRIKKHITKREYQIENQKERIRENNDRLDVQESRLESFETYEKQLQQSIENAQKQKLEALRERDEARTDRDMTKIIKDVQNCVLSPVSDKVDIFSEEEEKRTLTGKIKKPATVTLTRDEYEKLIHQATVNEQLNRMAGTIDEKLEMMEEKAREINENRIDKQKSADFAAKTEEGRRASRLEKQVSRLEKQLSNTKVCAEAKIHVIEREYERQLKHAKESVSEEKEKVAKLRSGIEKLQSKDNDNEWLRKLFPQVFERMNKMKHAMWMQYSYDNDFEPFKEYRELGWNDKDILDEYKAACEMANIEPRKDIIERYEDRREQRSYDDEWER